MTQLTFELEDSGPVDVPVRRLVVAGYTGRDREAVQRHIDELAEAGIPPPASVPAFYELDPALVVPEGQVTIDGEQTSGELEPVVVFTDAGPLLSVGSDHTDRELERSDVAKSKGACPKIVGRSALPLAAVTDVWDHGHLRSSVGGRPYQDAGIDIITPPPELIRIGEREVGTFATGTVLFLGTVPLLRSFDFAPDFSGRLEFPDLTPLTLEYTASPSKEQLR